ncbi:MAG: hypothetical protein JXB40_04455, partial [Candidatus Omnitrophica bacterium]|nr:hypothetical protein [Candidatus Omnitrophota bacterium]
MNAWRIGDTVDSTRDEMGSKSLIMDWQSPRNKKWIRIVALILVVTFINQDLVWAQDGAPVWSKGQNGSFSFKPPVNVASPINVPKDVAVTKEVYTAPGDRTIINIQDAHASLGAQESIASVLDSLATNYDLKLIAIEGSSGYVDTSILSTFPDDNIKKDTAKHFMAAGKLSAGEFFAITSGKQIAVYGIEDKSLYLENADQFRAIHEAGAAIAPDIKNLLAALKTLQDKIYSQDMKDLTANSVLHKDGKLTFTQRWSLVKELADKTHSDYRRYENLTKLVEALKLEKGISFDKANKERDALIDTLSKQVSKQNLEEIVLKSLLFKTGKISQGEYYIFLQDKAEKADIDASNYKNLITYTEYITLYESIDLTAIFEEVRAFEDQIMEKIFTGEDQKKLYEISKCAEFLKDLFEMKLTNADFAYLSTHIENCNAAFTASYIKDASLKYGVVLSGGYDLGKIFNDVPMALSFYRTAEKRNHTILANTIERMKEKGQNVAALITGGYHSQGITELLRQNRTSYIVILPKFDASKGERPYVAILTNQKDDYDNLLASGKYKIATDNYFNAGIADPKKVELFIQDIVITSLAQAVMDRKDLESVKKLWIQSYKDKYEELVSQGYIRGEGEIASAASLPRNDESVASLPRNDGVKPADESSTPSLREGYGLTPADEAIPAGDTQIAVTSMLPNSLSPKDFGRLVEAIKGVRLSASAAVMKLNDAYITVEREKDGAITSHSASAVEIKVFERSLSAQAGAKEISAAELQDIYDRLGRLEADKDMRVKLDADAEANIKAAIVGSARSVDDIGDLLNRQFKAKGLQNVSSEDRKALEQSITVALQAKLAEKPIAEAIPEKPVVIAEKPVATAEEPEVSEVVGGELIPDIYIVEAREKEALANADGVSTVAGMMIVSGRHVQDIRDKMGITTTGRFLTEAELIKRADAERDTLPQEATKAEETAIKEAESALPPVAAKALHGNIRIVDGMDKFAKIYFKKQGEWYLLVDRRAIDKDGHLKVDVREFDIPHEGYHIVLRQEFQRFGRSVNRGAEEEVMTTLLTVLRLIAFFKIHNGQRSAHPRLAAILDALNIDISKNVDIASYTKSIIKYITEVGGPVVTERTETGDAARYVKYRKELTEDKDINRRVLRDMEYYAHRVYTAMIKHLVTNKILPISLAAVNERVMRNMVAAANRDDFIKLLKQSEDLEKFLENISDLSIQYLATAGYANEQPFAIVKGYDQMLGVSPDSKDIVEILAVAGEDRVLAAQRAWKPLIEGVRDEISNIVKNLNIINDSSPDSDIKAEMSSIIKSGDTVTAKLDIMNSVAMGKFTQDELLSAVSENGEMDLGKLKGLKAPEAVSEQIKELERLRSERERALRGRLQMAPASFAIIARIAAELGYLPLLVGTAAILLASLHLIYTIFLAPRMPAITVAVRSRARDAGGFVKANVLPFIFAGAILVFTAIYAGNKISAENTARPIVPEEAGLSHTVRIFNAIEKLEKERAAKPVVVHDLSNTNMAPVDIIGNREIALFVTTNGKSYIVRISYVDAWVYPDLSDMDDTAIIAELIKRARAELGNGHDMVITPICSDRIHRYLSSAVERNKLDEGFKKPLGTSEGTFTISRTGDNSVSVYDIGPTELRVDPVTGKHSKSGGLAWWQVAILALVGYGAYLWVAVKGRDIKKNAEFIKLRLTGLKEVRVKKLTDEQNGVLSDAVLSLKAGMRDAISDIETSKIKIWRNMKELAAFRRGGIDISDVALGNTLAAAISIYHERLHEMLKASRARGAIPSNEEEFYEEVFVTTEIIKYLYDKVSAEERSAYLQFLKDTFAINSANFINMINEYEALAAKGQVTPERMTRLAAKYVKRVYARDWLVEMGDKEFSEFSKKFNLTTNEARNTINAAVVVLRDSLNAEIAKAAVPRGAKMPVKEKVKGPPVVLAKGSAQVTKNGTIEAIKADKGYVRVWKEHQDWQDAVMEAVNLYIAENKSVAGKLARIKGGLTIEVVGDLPRSAVIEKRANGRVAIRVNLKELQPKRRSHLILQSIPHELDHFDIGITNKLDDEILVNMKGLTKLTRGDIRRRIIASPEIMRYLRTVHHAIYPEVPQKKYTDGRIVSRLKDLSSSEDLDDIEILVSGFGRMLSAEAEAANVFAQIKDEKESRAKAEALKAKRAAAKERKAEEAARAAAEEEALKAEKARKAEEARKAKEARIAEEARN